MIDTVPEIPSRDYRLIFKKMTVEEGELSPSMKQKRYFIVNKYKELSRGNVPRKSNTPRY